jgi:hypothetical protein
LVSVSKYRICKACAISEEEVSWEFFEELRKMISMYLKSLSQRICKFLSEYSRSISY